MHNIAVTEARSPGSRQNGPKTVDEWKEQGETQSSADLY